MDDNDRRNRSSISLSTVDVDRMQAPADEWGATTMRRYRLARRLERHAMQADLLQRADTFDGWAAAMDAINASRVPGNEPDPGDMSVDPDLPTPLNTPDDHSLPDDEAEKLGNFA